LTKGNSTYLSFPLTDDPVYTDTVTQITSSSSHPDTISVTGTNAFSSNGSVTVPLTPPASPVPYYVKFITGNQAGRILLVTAYTPTSLTLDLTDHTGVSPVPLSGNSDSQSAGLPAFNVALGDQFEVFAGYTLSSAFGSGTTENPLLITGYTNKNQADEITVLTTSPGVLTTYWYDTSSPAQWVLATASGPTGTYTYTPGIFPASAGTVQVPVSQAPLYPYAPLEVTIRPSSPTATLTLMGRVSEVPLLAKVKEASTYVSTLSAADLTLTAIGNTGTVSQLGSNWKESASHNFANAIGYFSGLGNPPIPEAVFQSTTGTWLNSSTGAATGTIVFPAGSCIIIKQLNPVSGAGTYLQLPMNYSVTGT
jgi:hypothetical protein